MVKQFATFLGKIKYSNAVTKIKMSATQLKKIRKGSNLKYDFEDN